MTRKPRRNIGLIGFMGTGKSTIGKALAESTGMKFFDTDSLVEKLAVKTITQIFREDGEDSFRRLESIVIEKVCKNESAVISFGGGSVLSPLNVEMMKSRSIIILLRASVKTVLMRTASNNLRPLLVVDADNIENRIASLIEDRRTAYENAMDFAIDTDHLEINDAVETIRKRLDI
ncbi:MAG: shikimate kinase [Candidatus Thorarchaeota archaeon]